MKAFAANVVVGLADQVEFPPEDVEKVCRYFLLRRLGAPWDYARVILCWTADCGNPCPLALSANKCIRIVKARTAQTSR